LKIRKEGSVAVCGTPKMCHAAQYHNDMMSFLHAHGMNCVHACYWYECGFLHLMMCHAWQMITVRACIVYSKL